jgi:hypothetical protein
MIKIHPNIIVGSPSDLSSVLNSVHYIINCSINLNNLIVHSNYLNLNIQQFTFDSLQILNSVFDFINCKILLNQNIFLLCENGINNSLVVGIFIIMKLHNSNYNDVYNYMSTIHQINPYNFYSGLKYFEPCIISKSIDKMDIS